MPTLSEKDLSNVEKFFNAMQAAKNYSPPPPVVAPPGNSASPTLVPQRSKAFSPTMPGSGGSASSSTTALGATANSSLGQSFPSIWRTPEASLSQYPVTAAERRLWAEVAFVYWRIAGQQKSYLLSFVTSEPVKALSEFAAALLQYIWRRLQSGGKANWMTNVGELGSDRVFFLLKTLTGSRTCAQMMGSPEDGGALHAAVCQCIKEGNHLRWMSQTYTELCDACCKSGSTCSEMPASHIHSAREVLQCLQQCCQENALCAAEMLHAEPVAHVTRMFHRIKLQLQHLVHIAPQVNEQEDQPAATPPKQGTEPLSDPKQSLAAACETGSPKADSGEGAAIAPIDSHRRATLSLVHDPLGDENRMGPSGDSPRTHESEGGHVKFSEPHSTCTETVYKRHSRWYGLRMFDEVSDLALLVVVAAVSTTDDFECVSVIPSLVNYFHLSATMTKSLHENEEDALFAMYNNVVRILHVLWVLMNVAEHDKKDKVVQELLHASIIADIGVVIRQCAGILSHDITLLHAIRELCEIGHASTSGLAGTHSECAGGGAAEALGIASDPNPLTGGMPDPYVVLNAGSGNPAITVRPAGDFGFFRPGGAPADNMASASPPSGPAGVALASRQPICRVPPLSTTRSTVAGGGLNSSPDASNLPSTGALGNTAPVSNMSIAAKFMNLFGTGGVGSPNTAASRHHSQRPSGTAISWHGNTALASNDQQGIGESFATGIQTPNFLTQNATGGVTGVSFNSCRQSSAASGMGEERGDMTTIHSECQLAFIREIMAMLREIVTENTLSYHVRCAACSAVSQVSLRNPMAFELFGGRDTLATYLRILLQHPKPSDPTVVPRTLQDRPGLLSDVDDGEHAREATGLGVSDSSELAHASARGGVNARDRSASHEVDDEVGGARAREPLPFSNTIAERGDSVESGEAGCENSVMETTSGTSRSMLENPVKDAVALYLMLIKSLERVYQKLSIPPLTNEIVQILDLPLRFYAGAYEAFRRIVELWNRVLVGAACDEDIDASCLSVLLGLFQRFVMDKQLPSAKEEEMGVAPRLHHRRRTATADPRTAATASGAPVLSRSTSLTVGGASGSAPNLPGSPNFELTLMGESVLSDTLRAMPNMKEVERLNRLIAALSGILSVIVHRTPQVLRPECIRVLVEMVCLTDPSLSRLSKQCVFSTLDTACAYGMYAAVLPQLEVTQLIHVLPLFPSFFCSREKTDTWLQQRRTWMVKGGCVEVVIGIMETVLSDPSSSELLPKLIPILFEFFCRFEPSQPTSPRLSETTFKDAFRAGLQHVEGEEYISMITQAVLNSATGEGGLLRAHGHSSRRVQMHGLLTIPAPICAAERPFFLDLVPILAARVPVRSEFYVHLVEAVRQIVSCTINVRSMDLLQWALDTKQSSLLPFLELPSALMESLPYDGDRRSLQEFWCPILAVAQTRSEIRFISTGGVVVSFAEWPERGFSVTALFRFEEICNAIPLFDLRSAEDRQTASFVLVDGDSVQLMHDNRRSFINENHALQGLETGKWMHFTLVLSVARTATFYMNGARIGTCAMPYFRPGSEVTICIGFVHKEIDDVLYSIGDITLYDEELTDPQVEAELANTEYNHNVAKITEREIPRDLQAHNTPPPINDRIARYVPYHCTDQLLLNVLNNARYTTIAKLSGKHCSPPENWVNYRLLFLSRGGLIHLLDWIGCSRTTTELEFFVGLLCECVRDVTTSSTRYAGTYLLLEQQLKALAPLISPRVCDSLMRLAVAVVAFNDQPHCVVINRLVFDFVLGDAELYARMPVESALHLANAVERVFAIGSCRYAKRNAEFVMAPLFVDRLLNSLLFSPFHMGFQLREALMGIVREVLLATDFAREIVASLATFAGQLTPTYRVVTGQRNPFVVVKVPAPQFPEVSAAPYLTVNYLCTMILRLLVRYSTNTSFMTSFSRIIDLNWFVTCTSRFAGPASVVYATRLLCEALSWNSSLRETVARNQATILEALEQHAMNDDLLLLLLGTAVGAAKNVDLLSTKFSLLQQLDGVMSSMVSEPDTVIAPIFTRMFSVHLQQVLVVPSCFRPFGLTLVRERYLHLCMRVRRYFIIALLCGRMMLSISKKRYVLQKWGLEDLTRLPQMGVTLNSLSSPRSRLTEAESSGSSPLSSPSMTAIPNVEESIQLMEPAASAGQGYLARPVVFSLSSRISLDYTAWGRHRRALSAVRIAASLNMYILRRRYAPLAENRSRVAELLKEKSHSVSMFVLQMVKRIAANPTMFYTLTISPVQVTSLVAFATFVPPSQEMLIEEHRLLNDSIASVGSSASTKSTLGNATLLDGPADAAPELQTARSNRGMESLPQFVANSVIGEDSHSPADLLANMGTNGSITVTPGRSIATTVARNGDDSCGVSEVLPTAPTSKRFTAGATIVVPEGGPPAAAAAVDGDTGDSVSTTPLFYPATRMRRESSHWDPMTPERAGGTEESVEVVTSSASTTMPVGTETADPATVTPEPTALVGASDRSLPKEAEGGAGPSKTAALWNSEEDDDDDDDDEDKEEGNEDTKALNDDDIALGGSVARLNSEVAPVVAGASCALQLENLRTGSSLVADHIRSSAVDVLRTLVNSSLRTLPPTGWTGGSTYGSCGGLLFQLLAASASPLFPQETGHVLINFFMHTVATDVRKQHKLIAPQPAGTAAPGPGTTAVNLGSPGLQPSGSLKAGIPAAPSTPGSAPIEGGTTSDTFSNTFNRTGSLESSLAIPGASFVSLTHALHANSGPSSSTGYPQALHAVSSVSGYATPPLASGVAEGSSAIAASGPSKVLSDVFLFNTIRFVVLLGDLLAMEVFEIGAVTPFFRVLLASCVTWPQRYVDQLRSQVVRCCVSVLNKPAVYSISVEILEDVLRLLEVALVREWIEKGVLERLFRVLYRVFVAFPPTWMTVEETVRRRVIVVLILRFLVRTYFQRRELRKALTLSTLTQRVLLCNEITEALMRPTDDEAVASFEALMAQNASSMDALMSVRPKAKADQAHKADQKMREEHFKRVRAFNSLCGSSSEIQEGQHVDQLQAAFAARFSSFVDTFTPLDESSLQWLVARRCSFESRGSMHPYFHSYDCSHNCVPISKHQFPGESGEKRPGDADAAAARTAVDGASGSAGAAARRESLVGASGGPRPPAETSSIEASSDALHITMCDQVNHISALFPLHPLRGRPYCVDAPFVDPSIRLSSSALSLLMYLLDPSESLRFITNGFRINGIHTTPCLILVTNLTIKVIAYSYYSPSGDVILCQYDELDQGTDFTPSVSNLSRSGNEASFSKAAEKAKGAFSYAKSFAQRLLDSKSKERERRRDGTKVAKSVRQSTGHTYRNLYWVYLLKNVTRVRALAFMHQSTALQLSLFNDEGPMFSIVDAELSMNAAARDAFIRVLRTELKKQRCAFTDESQLAASLRFSMKRWSSSGVSTFDYLMHINEVAGRTFQDYNQYPVMPWVLADYVSDELDLDSEQSYRNLALPMGAQTEERRQKVQMLYEQLQEVHDPATGECFPFHHGTHFSTSGGTLYFLLRIQPYTAFARVFQGGSFDVATRLFASVAMSYQSCVNGPADCKELPPEFYFTGKFLSNTDGLQLGERDDGVVVSDVQLPPWAKGSVQVFVELMRYALESEYVSKNIHQWIDLVFGVRRRGKLAVESWNVFQHMTYGEDVVKALKAAQAAHDIDVIVAEADNFGQSPTMVFVEAHPPRGTIDSVTLAPEIAPQVAMMLAYAFENPPSCYHLGEPAPQSLHPVPPTLVADFCSPDTSVLGFTTLQSSGKRAASLRQLMPVDDGIHFLCWHERESRLMRFDAQTGSFLSFIQFETVDKTNLRITSAAVALRESLVVVGVGSGTVYFLFPQHEDGVVLLTCTMCQHTHSITGFSLNEKTSRVVSFTSSCDDPPIVSRVQHASCSVLFRLDLSFITEPKERIAASVAHTQILTHTIVVTSRWLCIFDINGELFASGRLPTSRVPDVPMLEDENGDECGVVLEHVTPSIADMTSVCAFDTREWAAGRTLYLTGHQDGSIWLWRATRLPPGQVGPGRIAKLEPHAALPVGSTNQCNGSVTALRQEMVDIPVFLVGYRNGTTHILSFELPPTAEK